MKLLVCGDRNWDDPLFIQYAISIIHQVYEPIELIIEGGARGADYYAKLAGQKLGIQVDEYPAEWDLHGKAAGPIRNRQMLLEGKPDMVLAFHNNITKSKGTADMIQRAEKAGIKTRLITKK